MYLSKLQNIFVQILQGICSNGKIVGRDVAFFSPSSNPAFSPSVAKEGNDLHVTRDNKKPPIIELQPSQQNFLIIGKKKNWKSEDLYLAFGNLETYGSLISRKVHLAPTSVFAFHHHSVSAALSRYLCIMWLLAKLSICRKERLYLCEFWICPLQH